MNSVLQLNEFFVEGDNQELSHVLLHIIQPSTPEEEKEKGYFFVACEINNGDKEDVVNLQALMDQVENDYYEIPNEPNKDALEVILDKINHENFALTRPEADLHCLVGALRGNELVFSFCGHPEALLFYKNKSGQFQKMDLVAANEEDAGEDKLFSQIIQGRVSPGDYFFVGTSHIASCFNHDRLQKIIAGGRTTEQSAEHFEKVLAGIKNGYSFGGLIIHFSPETDIVKTEKIAKVASENTIFNAEQKTARTLSPSLFDNINNKMRTDDKEDDDDAAPVTEKIVPQTASAHLKQRPVIKTAEPIGPKIISAIKIIGKGLRYIGYGVYYFFFILAKLIVNLGRLIIMLFFVATNLQNRRRAILESWADSIRAFKRRMNELPLITKILAIASITVAVVFIGSVLYLQTQKNRIEANQAYREGLQLVKNQTDAAESALIYGDENSAKQQANEAKNLLANFVCQPADKQICSEISGRLATLTQKLRRMDTVAAALVVDWGALGFGTVEKIVKVESKLIGFASNTSTVAVYDLLTKENKFIIASENALNGFIAGAVPKENDYAVLLSSDKKTIVIFDPKTASIKKGEISYAGAPEIKSLIVYNRRLYTLDVAANQIYRHDNIKGGFGQGKDWLTNSTLNIRDGVDMAIDGDMYILKATGELYKFTQGEPQPLNLEPPEPPLDSANEIWTYTDLNNIYLLDAKNKRVIIYDKTGKLLRQMTAEDFTGPSSFAVEESKGTAYVLDSNKIYEIKIK
ncbi:MAG: hypothetical protein NTW66_02620 [Candidatus Magasanikbacteria bacterium]|nr:hypothetical protein [Candidatus Magasanikbacteria bacterium]